MLGLWKSNNSRPHVLVHACCAPCSSTVLELLHQYAELTVYFYNPNIHPLEEYNYRALVTRKFIADFNKKRQSSIHFVEGEYDVDNYMEMTQSEKDAPERGKRCLICYRMRLEKAARKALELSCDYFASSLTLSPMKNSDAVNAFGLEIQSTHNINYLPSDFKKNAGYQQSIQLSNEYGIYRQNYCGCIYAVQNSIEN